MRSEHDAQLRMKREEAERKRKEDDQFARMWLDDMQSKARREEDEVRKQADGNRQTAAVLQQQMEQLEQKKQLEKQLQQEQAQILVSFITTYVYAIFVIRRLLTCTCAGARERNGQVGHLTWRPTWPADQPATWQVSVC